LWPFRGALVAFGGEHGKSDSRFLTVNEEKLTDEQWQRLYEMKIDGENTLPEHLTDAFRQHGVAVTLSGFYTVFGQTIEGFEVTESIVSVDTDRLMRPQEEIRIISIELENKENENQTED
jgi:cyclophilin family peptidyl-prolyl cis-trans isomerase